jgi:uncharacterized protein YjbJ (UPF0337 family)
VPCDTLVEGTEFQAETLPAKQAKGAVRKAAGKVVGDARLQAEGKADKAEGKLQNAVGGLKNAIRRVWGSLSEKPGRGAPARVGCGLLRRCKRASGEKRERPSDTAGLGRSLQTTGRRCDGCLAKAIDHARDHSTHPANPGFGGQALYEGLVEASPLTGPADPVGRSISDIASRWPADAGGPSQRRGRLNASATG